MCPQRTYSAALPISFFPTLSSALSETYTQLHQAMMLVLSLISLQTPFHRNLLNFEKN